MLSQGGGEVQILIGTLHVLIGNLIYPSIYCYIKGNNCYKAGTYFYTIGANYYITDTN